MNPDDATVLALRTDLALQIARRLGRGAETQAAAAARLGVPQPTLSRIRNGRIETLSLELLLRIAVRAGLQPILQVGADPSEAGVHVRGEPPPERTQRSVLDVTARDATAASVTHLRPEQRLEAQLRHSELLAELQRAARSTRERRRAAAGAAPG
jgi:predicted XRE-type DNA-binding protein